MAVIKAVSSRAGIGQALDYVTKEEKTEEKLVSGLHCEPDTAKDEMQATKEMWGKTGGRTYKHFVQSYHADEKITPEQAHRNAEELAKNTEAWKGFEVLISTHIDRWHTHTHFIVNSVSYEDGHKLQWSKADLQDLKDRCNEQSRQQGLHVPEKGKTFSGEEREITQAWTKDTYQTLKQAEKGKVESYVQNITLAIIEAKQTAKSKEEFIEQMESHGYSVDWQDSHKNITFTDKEREEHGETKCKVRNSRLEKYYNIDFSKEGLLNEFKANRAEAERPRAEQPSLANTVREIQSGLSAEDDRMQRIEETLAEVRADRERAKQPAAGSIRSGSSRAGNTPDREPEIKTETAGEQRARESQSREISERADRIRAGHEEVKSGQLRNDFNLNRMGRQIQFATGKIEKIGAEQRGINEKANSLRDKLNSIRERIIQVRDSIRQRFSRAEQTEQPDNSTRPTSQNTQSVKEQKLAREKQSQDNAQEPQNDKKDSVREKLEKFTQEAKEGRQEQTEHIHQRRGRHR